MTTNLETMERPADIQAEFNRFKQSLVDLCEQIYKFHKEYPDGNGGQDDRLEINQQVFDAFGREWKWRAPDGYKIAVPSELAGFVQVIQPQGDGFVWAQPTDTERGKWKVGKADSIVFEKDGFYAVDTNARAILYKPSGKHTEPPLKELDGLELIED